MNENIYEPNEYIKLKNGETGTINFPNNYLKCSFTVNYNQYNITTFNLNKDSNIENINNNNLYFLEIIKNIYNILDLSYRKLKYIDAYLEEDDIISYDVFQRLSYGFFNFKENTYTKYKVTIQVNTDNKWRISFKTYYNEYFAYTEWLEKFNIQRIIEFIYDVEESMLKNNMEFETPLSILFKKDLMQSYLDHRNHNNYIYKKLKYMFPNQEIDSYDLHYDVQYKKEYILSYYYHDNNIYISNTKNNNHYIVNNFYSNGILRKDLTCLLLRIFEIDKYEIFKNCYMKPKVNNSIYVSYNDYYTNFYISNNMNSFVQISNDKISIILGPYQYGETKIGTGDKLENKFNPENIINILTKVDTEYLFLDFQKGKQHVR